MNRTRSDALDGGMKRREYERHLQALGRVKSSVDNKQPERYNHIRVDAKRRLAEEERREKVNRDNLILVNRMMEIERRSDQHYITQHAPQKEYRERIRYMKIENLTNENKKIADRIADAHPTYVRVKQLDEFKKHERSVKVQMTQPTERELRKQRSALSSGKNSSNSSKKVEQYAMLGCQGKQGAHQQNSARMSQLPPMVSKKYIPSSHKKVRNTHIERTSLQTPGSRNRTVEVALTINDNYNDIGHSSDNRDNDIQNDEEQPAYNQSLSSKDQIQILGEEDVEEDDVGPEYVEVEQEEDKEEEEEEKINDESPVSTKAPSQNDSAHNQSPPSPPPEVPVPSPSSPTSPTNLKIPDKQASPESPDAQTLSLTVKRDEVDDEEISNDIITGNQLDHVNNENNNAITEPKEVSDHIPSDDRSPNFREEYDFTKEASDMRTSDIIDNCPIPTNPDDDDTSGSDWVDPKCLREMK